MNRHAIRENMSRKIENYLPPYFFCFTILTKSILNYCDFPGFEYLPYRKYFERRKINCVFNSDLVIRHGSLFVFSPRQYLRQTLLHISS